MLNAGVQNKAFPLAGLLTNVNPKNLIKPNAVSDGLLSIVMVHDLMNLTKPHIDNLSKPDIHRCVMMTNDDILNQKKPEADGVKAGKTVPANASSSFSRRAGVGSSETTTHTHVRAFLESIKKGGNLEFSDSIKKDLPTVANPVYGYSAPAKSGVGIGVLVITKATHDAPSVFFCAVNSVHLFFSVPGIIRGAHKIMVGCVGASSEAPVSFVSGYANPMQSTTSEIGVSGGGLHHTKEAAAMLATTPTQNPQFIWLIAAVRRDIPTVSAKIYHVTAESEREARRPLARDHVCFFAGRIRLGGG